MWVYGDALIPDTSDVAGVRDISAADSRFRLDQFLAHAKDTYCAAKADADVTIDHTAVIDAASAAAATPLDDGPLDLVTVRIGAQVGGRKVVEDWRFQRRSVVFAEQQPPPAACTGCGAGLSVDIDGNCTYCGTHLIGVAGPWVVAGVDEPRILEPPTPNLSLAGLGPDFPTTDFLAFASSVYLNVHHATAGDSLDGIRDVLATGMRTYLASQPEELAWDLRVDHLLSCEIVDVRHGALDAVTVRFAAASDGMDFVEDWTFERTTARPGAPAPANCELCGSPVELDENGNCRYCRTHLAGVAGQWRVARAAVPAQPMATHPVVIRAMQHRGLRILLLVLVLLAFVGTIVAIMAIALAA